MNQIQESVSSFFNRFPEAYNQGRKTELEEFDLISKKVKKRIPSWYKELVLKYPLAELEIGIPSDFGQPMLKSLKIENQPLMSTEIHSISAIDDEATDTFPGYVLIDRTFFWQQTYFCFGTDIESTQEGIYLSCKDTNPTPYLVFHDYGETTSELIKNSNRILNSFSDIFKFSKIPNDKRVIPKEKIPELFQMLESITKILKHLANNSTDRIPKHFQKTEKQMLSELIEKVTDNIKLNKPKEALLRVEHIYDIQLPSIGNLMTEIKDAYSFCDLHQGDLYFLEKEYEDK